MSMIDLASGKIILYRSNFVITFSLTPEELEKSIPHQIRLKHKTDTNYIHYNVVCDIDPFEYVMAQISFFKKILYSISFYPQNSTHSLSDLNFSPIDLVSARNIAYAWFQKHFKEQSDFTWGTVKFFPGSDPIYGPANIELKYNTL